MDGGLFRAQQIRDDQMEEETLGMAKIQTKRNKTHSNNQLWMIINALVNMHRRPTHAQHTHHPIKAVMSFMSVQNTEI